MCFLFIDESGRDVLVHFEITLGVGALVGGIGGSEFVGLAVGTSGDEVGEDFVFKFRGVGLCSVDDVRGEIDNSAHELFTAKFTMLHLTEFAFPVASHGC